MADDIQRFLEALYGKKPPDLYTLLWNRQNKTSKWFRDIPKAAEYARLNAVNIYSGVGFSPTDYGPRQRCKADEIAGISALSADVDYLGAAHNTKILPKDESHALRLIPKDFPPSMIVESGHGLQMWWIFDVPWVFHSDEERKQAQAMALRWDRFLKLRAARLGYSLDSVFDLARIMRVPGTTNQKEGLPPVPATILSLTETRYKLAQFTALMDAAMPPAIINTTATAIDAPAIEEPEIPLKKPGIMPRAVDPVVYRPNAVIHPGIFAALWSNDPGFRMTWGGNRPEFADKSQSAFDLSLANILYDAGVSDQDTADALVHHRRLRNQPKKANPAAYLVSTLTTARERTTPRPAYKEVAASIAAMLSGELPADDQGLPSLDAIEKLATRAYQEEPPIDIPDLSSMDRTTAVGKFSTGLGMTVNGLPVSVTRILRVPDGKSCSWQFVFNHGRSLFLSNEADWSDYSRFAAAIRTQLNGICLVPVNKTTWARTMVPYIQAGMEDVAQAGTDYPSTIRDIIDGYLVTRGIVTQAQAYATVRMNGLPFPFKREIDPVPLIAIYVQDVINWIFRYRGEKQNSTDFCNGLSGIGAVAWPIHRNRRTTQSRWLLPATWKAEIYNTIHERDQAIANAAPGKEEEEEEEDKWQN